jgi:hypothetical protein
MRPAGLSPALKNNEKNPQRRDEWMAGKTIGRPKQHWVEDAYLMSGSELLSPRGYWEKVRA